jgi:hypothetical protein
VKLADDADLEQGLAATRALGSFFGQLATAALDRGGSAYELLSRLS